MTPTTTTRRPSTTGRPRRASPAGRAPARAGSRRPPVDPRIRQRRASGARRRARRRLVVLVALLVVGGLVVAADWGLHTSAFRARVVHVTGAVHTPQAAIVAAAGLGAHPPLVSLDLGAAAARVEALPWVARASLRRDWPDGVTVAVTERVPVAAMSVSPTGTGPVVLVDRTGRVLATEPGAPAGLVRLEAGPGLVPAADATSLRPGTPVPAALGAGLAVAASLPPAFGAQVAAIEVLPGPRVHLALTSPLTVELGDTSDLAAKYEAVAAIVSGAALAPDDVIDVSVPDSPTVTGP